MKHLKAVAVFLLLLVSFAGACTTFLLTGESEDELVFGRNYDWEVGAGLLIVNKAGVAKSALTFGGDEITVEWVSRYGSITFNQFGREFPMGGINEVGLVIEVMWMSETTYPEPDARPTIIELQWVQYQLDTAATVEDVLTSDEYIRISQNSFTPLHFLVADATGDCATVEFIEGKLVAHRNDELHGDELPYPVLTNSTYDASLISKSESKEAPEGSGSLERFCRAAAMVASYSPCPCCGNYEDITEYAFSILDSVSAGERTQWSIVYDIPMRRIHYRTYANPLPRSVELASFNFSCETKVSIIDVDTGDGAVDDMFSLYSYEANRELIGEVYGGIDFLQGVPEQALDAIAAYPEQFPCITAESLME